MTQFVQENLKVQAQETEDQPTCESRESNNRGARECAPYTGVSMMKGGSRLCRSERLLLIFRYLKESSLSPVVCQRQVTKLQQLHHQSAFSQQLRPGACVLLTRMASAAMAQPATHADQARCTRLGTMFGRGTPDSFDGAAH